MISLSVQSVHTEWTARAITLDGLMLGLQFRLFRGFNCHIACNCSLVKRVSAHFIVPLHFLKKKKKNFPKLSLGERCDDQNQVGRALPI